MLSHQQSGFHSPAGDTKAFVCCAGKELHGSLTRDVLSCTLDDRLWKIPLRNSDGTVSVCNYIFVRADMWSLLWNDGHRREIHYIPNIFGRVDGDCRAWSDAGGSMISKEPGSQRRFALQGVEVLASMDG